MAAAVLPAVPAAARTPTLPFMPAGERADAPFGFVEMCRRDAVLCSAGVAPRAACVTSAPLAVVWAAMRVDLSFLCQQETSGVTTATYGASDELKLLRQVNSAVNRFTVKVADSTAGSGDDWRRANGKGDCEDMAIEKRMRLVEAGFDPSRLFFAVAYRRGFGLHTLLIARLADGDRVLDSLSPHVLRWADVRYSWLRRQTTGNPLAWVRVEQGGTERLAASGTRPLA